MALKVLVADHSESISKAIHLSLEDLAVRVQPITLDKLTHPNDTALSLEKGIIKMVGSFNPSIIFLDTLLAKMNGYEITKILKSDENIKSIPIILMYSSITGIDEEKFKASNADDILEKPFTQEKLRNLVIKYLNIDSSPFGEEVELPLIEDLEKDIMEQVQSSPFHLNDQNSSDINASQTSGKNDNILKPKGLINSELELNELQKSLSEIDIDGEEDFQQVNLFPSSASDTQKKKETSKDKALDFSKIDFTDTSAKKEPVSPSQASIDIPVKTSSSKPKISPSLFRKNPFQAGFSQSGNKDEASQKNIYFQKKEVEDLLHKPTNSSEDEKEDSITITSSEEKASFVLDTSKDSELKANTKPTILGKPSESSFDDAFRLDINTENISDNEIDIENLESEDDMGHIDFLTASEAQQTDKEVKKQDEKIQSQLDEKLREEMKKMVHEEVRKMVQDQIQRTLDKELPQIAKKLIKEEITRLLSEYK